MTYLPMAASTPPTHLKTLQCQGLLIHLACHDRGADSVLLGQRQPKLLQQEVGLLMLLHGAARLHGNLLQRLAGLIHQAIRLVDAAENARQTGTLQLDEDLEGKATSAASCCFPKWC